jgi:hypothetical protein
MLGGSSLTTNYIVGGVGAVTPSTAGTVPNSSRAGPTKDAPILPKCILPDPSAGNYDNGRSGTFHNGGGGGYASNDIRCFPRGRCGSVGFLSLFYSPPILFLLIGDLSLIDDLGDETVDSSGRKLPLVAIVALGGGVLADSLNYDEITNVPQVYTLAEGSFFSGFCWLVGLTWWDYW